MRERLGVLRKGVGLSWRADRKATAITLVTFSLRPVAPVLIAYLVKLIVDATVAGETGTLVLTSVLIALTAALAAGGGAISLEISARMIEATGAHVDSRIMSLIGRLPGIQHLEAPELLDRLEVLKQERVYMAEGADSLSLVLGTITRGLATAVLLAVINPLLLLIPLLAVPSLLASNRWERNRNQAMDASAADARLARRLFASGAEPAAGREVRLFGLDRFVRARHRETGATADRLVADALRRSLLPTGLGGLVFALGYGAALVVVIREFARGTGTVGDVVLALSLVTSINLQVTLGIQFVRFMQQTMASVRRLLWLEDYAEREHARVRGEADPPERLQDGILVEGVTFAYPGTDRPALRDATLRLPAGSVVAVVGPNGAGKTTLVKLLARMYTPDEGRILVDGVDLQEFDIETWRSSVSACFQSFARLEFTAQYSVGLGALDRRDDADEVSRAIREGGAEDVLAQLPNGLSTLLGHSHDGGRELSGGQWQRLALARGCMRPAPLVLMLDEPTAAVDPLAEDALLRRYLAAARQATATTRGITLIVSHRMSTARAADLVIVVGDGEVAEVGTHEDLVARPDGVYRQMYALQSKAYT
jgi:ABC-type multidrug transport system fused ATPase/permease subunit